MTRGKHRLGRKYSSAESALRACGCKEEQNDADLVNRMGDFTTA